MKPNLDKNIIATFRNLVNSTPIFYKDEKHEKHWNMFCAFMDRIDENINTLNNIEFLTDDVGNHNDVIYFIMHSDIIVESVKQLFKKLDIENPLEKNFEIFNQLGTGKGTDDKFFKHIRALSYAHSVYTSHTSPYVDKGEVQYSPYILNGSFHDRDKIIIKVYSTNEKKDYKSLIIPKKEMISYVESRYDNIVILNDYLESEVKHHVELQSSGTIEISDNPLETLHNLKVAAIGRYDESLINHINEIIYALNYNSKNKRNIYGVNKLKKYILKHMDGFIPLYEKYDGSDNDHPFHNVLSHKLKRSIHNSHYMLEKIRIYLDEESNGPNDYNFTDSVPFDRNTPSNVEWGFQQLKLFKIALADKYLDISYDMSFEEIQLLVTTSIYLDNFKSSKS